MNKFLTKVIKMNTLLKKIRNNRGNSLAEFAVTTAMMATLATTAAPRFSGIGEGAKEKKSLAEIDKIVIASSNFFLNPLIFSKCLINLDVIFLKSS